MSNKTIYLKFLFISLIVILAFNIFYAFLYQYEYRTYTINFNIKLNEIIFTISEKYPNVDKTEIIKILNSNNKYEDSILREYGIDINNDAFVLKNDIEFEQFIKINIITITTLGIVLIAIFIIYNYQKDKKLKEIQNYLEEINKKNYKLDIEDNREGELSILKNEVYKTTVFLKEQAENSLQDKTNLKDSISNISHQLKTPLTSISILLDNIIENPDMDTATRNEFIKDIRREIININFLVQALLKLSKFDANAVEFINKEVNIKQMLESAVKNIMPLCDLKKVEIELIGENSDKLVCDEKWQIEAISNILKNSVEYSNAGDTIYVKFKENNLYTQIDIKDSGKGIDKEDLPHIFDRFYKGKNSSKNSIGIGLALSKTIIEKSGGNIFAESKLGEGTRFVIRYF